MKLFLTAWAVLILSLSTRAADCSFTLFATDSGWYTAANYHDPENNNYLVGFHAAGPTEFRDWFVFDLPPSSAGIQSAELRLFVFSIDSTNAETFDLHHVVTPVSTLVAGAGPGLTNVFNDLGDGALYGTRAVSVTEANGYITIPLNSNAVAALAAAAGQRLAFGGSLSSISSTPVSDESLFSFSSGTAPYVQLIVTLSGTGAPIILQQPPPIISLPSGSTTNISVAACGSGTLRFQWFINNVALPNQTTSTLTLANVGGGQSGDFYYLVVTNASGATTSSITRVYIDAVPPFLTSGPYDRTVAVGNAADFYTYALGNPTPRLRWQLNGVNIPGETNNYLFIPSVQFSNAGTYTAVATNIFGTASNSAVLKVEPLIVNSLNEYGMYSGSDFYYPSSIESSVPVTYQWRFNGVNIPGANGAYLSMFNVLSNDAGAYDLIVANSYGVRTSGVGKITVAISAPQPTGPYLSSPALVGSDFLMSADVYGSAPISLQWYFNGAPINGGTNLQLLRRNISTLDAGGYSFVASNAFGVSTSTAPILTVVTQSPVISGSGISVEAFVEDVIRLTPNVSGGPRPTVQWQFNSVNIPGATNTSLVLTNLSLAQSGSYTLRAANSSGTNAFETFVNVKPRRALDRWTWRNSRPQANDLRHIAFGNGRVVSGGEGGSIVTSTNGIDWTVVSLGQQYLISHIAFGNGLFVAIANGYSTVLFTSSDGSNWTPYDIPIAYPQSLDFANGEFLMSGFGGNNYGYPIVLAHSANGSAWQVNPTIGAYSVPLSIRYGNGIYASISDFDICTSTDTINWTRHQVPGQFTRLTFANGLFIASARHGDIWTSADGNHWTARNSGVVQANGRSGDFNGVAYGNGFFVAVGDDGVIVRSPNASVWAALDSTTSQNLRDVVFDGTKFIACGNVGVLLTSLNSVTWTDRRGGKTKDLYGIIYTNGQFVAVGYEGTILTSPDGVGWTTRTSPNSRDLHAVTHGGGQYVAVGRRGAVLTSPDAINWTSRTTPSTNYLQRIAWGSGRFVVLGENATILSSTNAINWQLHPVNLPGDTQMEGVAYGNGVFAVVGGYFAPNAHSIMLVSSNGMSWSNVSYDLGKLARGVGFAFDNFIAVGNDGAVVFGNGLSWGFPFFVIPRQNLRHIKGAAGRFVAVGNEGTIVSREGTFLSSNLYNWEHHASIVADNLHDLAYGAGKFVAVGNGGAIVQSDDVRPVLSAPSYSGGQMRFNLSGGIAPEYDLQSSENLLSWLSENTFTNDGSTVSFTINTNGSSRFFRVRAP